MSEQSSSENLWSQWLKAWGKAAEQFGRTGMAQHSQELVKQWQELLRKVFEEAMNSESFLAQLGKNSEFVHVFRAQIEQMIERQLAAMHIPTTGTIDAVQAHLLQLDGRLAALDRRLDELAASLAPAPAAAERAGSPGSLP